MKRLAQWVALAALVMGLLSMAWWLWPQFRSSGPQRLNALPAATVRPLPSASANDAGQQTATPRQPPSQEDLRGSCTTWFGSLKDPLEGKALQTQWRAAQAQGEAQLIQMLAQIAKTGTPGERAAALYLQVRGQTLQAMSEFDARYPGCRASEACVAEYRSTTPLSGNPDVNAMAHLAVASRDPQLYGLAYQACQRFWEPSPSQCAHISAEQWALRDPNNGAPWLFIAEKAGRDGRASDKAEAIYRFTQAKAFDNGFSLVSELTRSEALRSDTPFVQSTVVDWAYQVQYLGPWSPYSVFTDYCSVPALRDANRTQVCNDVAKSLLHSTPQLMGAIEGVLLAKRLAWPAQQFADAREELDALKAVEVETNKLLYGEGSLSSDGDLSGQGLAGCKALDRITTFISTRMRVGEVQELRDRLATHKLSRAELAAQYVRQRPGTR